MYRNIGESVMISTADGSSTWEALKDMKEAYPVQLAQYALHHKLMDEPVFAWWAPHALKKVTRIKSKYWTRTHKFGIRIPKSVKEAIKLDCKNGNTLWWDAICKEMKNVRIAFEEFEGSKDQIPQDIKGLHVI